MTRATYCFKGEKMVPPPIWLQGLEGSLILFISYLAIYRPLQTYDFS